MPTYNFQEVKRTKTVKLKCGCGNRFQRTGSVSQTINPFNKNTDGVPKSRGEIWRELGTEIAGWEPNESRRQCPKCGATADVVQPKETAA